MTDNPNPGAFRPFRRQDLAKLPELARLSPERRDAIEAVASVLPFRVNEYVVRELIDWDNVPHDPMFQLTFPQEGMLEPEAFARMMDLVRRDAPESERRAVAREIQATMNPHPAGQLQLNVPALEGETVAGVQHKYRETALYFPAAGQTCHAYCTYCFRWAQFVGLEDLKFAAKEIQPLLGYLAEHPEVTDILFTGGDPMVMKTRMLRRHVEPLLKVDTVRTLRFGTKAPAYWPQRFTTDADADDLLRLFEEIVASGRHLAVMAHYSHPRELSTPLAQEALRRILSTGAVVRCQAPLIRHVNDDAAVWASMWQAQVQLGAVPYYMFVERDTGPKGYFEVPLLRALHVYQEAFRSVSGLARTARGPSMSATPGKVAVTGTARIGQEDVFVLKFLQAREPAWTDRTFFAVLDPEATWLGDLKPAQGEDSFFFEERMHRLRHRARVRRKQPEANRIREAEGPRRPRRRGPLHVLD